MMRWLPLLIFYSFQSFATFDVGIGASSFTGGRPVPALALGISGDKWGFLYRSVGVATTIYSQNAWTTAAYRVALQEKFGPGSATAGVGFGTSYLLRTYRESLTAPIEKNSQVVFGPHLSVKFTFGPVFFGFDTLLGLNKEVVQHIALNFQDIAHFSLGATF